MQVKRIAECSPWDILQYFRRLSIFELPFHTGVTVHVNAPVELTCDKCKIKVTKRFIESKERFARFNTIA